MGKNNAESKKIDSVPEGQETSVAPKATTKQNSAFDKYIVQQMPFILFTLGCSIAAYRFGPHLIDQVAFGIRDITVGPAMEAMQAIYDEVIAMRRDTLELRKEVMEAISETGVVKKTEEVPSSYGMSDFYEAFRMEPMDGMEVEPGLEYLFKDYDLESDPVYLNNKKEYDEISKDYGPMIERKSSEDKRFQVQWKKEKSEYTLFSTVNIPSNTFLGTFAGVITNHTIDPSTTWKYKGAIKDESGDRVDLVIDGRQKGNWFHFLQIQDKGNIEAFFLPYQNLWYIGFRTTKPVEKNQELVLNLGDLE
jgi:hypothetical protein